MTNNLAARICAALGLKRCRSLNLRLAVDDVVTVNATTYVDADQLAGVAEVLETNDYVLVKREDLRRLELLAGGKDGQA